MNASKLIGDLRLLCNESTITLLEQQEEFVVACSNEDLLTVWGMIEKLTRIGKYSRDVARIMLYNDLTGTQQNPGEDIVKFSNRFTHIARDLKYAGHAITTSELSHMYMMNIDRTIFQRPYEDYLIARRENRHTKSFATIVTDITDYFTEIYSTVKQTGGFTVGHTAGHNKVNGHARVNGGTEANRGKGARGNHGYSNNNYSATVSTVATQQRNNTASIYNAQASGSTQQSNYSPPRGSPTRIDKPCRDFQRGRCFRQNCRFSHGTQPDTRLSLESLQRQMDQILNLMAGNNNTAAVSTNSSATATPNRKSKKKQGKANNTNTNSSNQQPARQLPLPNNNNTSAAGVNFIQTNQPSSLDAIGIGTFTTDTIYMCDAVNNEGATSFAAEPAAADAPSPGLCLPLPIFAPNPSNTKNGVDVDSHGHLVMIKDEGARVCLIRDRELLSDLVTLDEPQAIITVNSKEKDAAIRTRLGGYLLPPLNKIFALYAPDARSNLLSDSHLRNAMEKEYDRATDSFIFTNADTGQTAVFQPSIHDDYYIYTGDIANHKMYQINLQQLGYTVKQIREAEAFQQVHKRLSYAGPDNIALLVKNKAINGLTPGIEAAQLWKKHMHKTNCSGCALGKTHVAPARASESAPVTRIGECTHWDVFYITVANHKPLYALLCVDEHSLFKIITVLPSREHKHILKAVKDVIALYASKGHTLSKGRFDHEGGFAPLPESLAAAGLTTEVEFAQPHRHVRRAEVVIRQIKEAFRATMFDLPYAMPVVFIQSLLKYVIGSLNMVYTTNNQQLTPFELFHSKSQSSVNYLRAAFGDIVLTYKYTNHIKKDVEPRGIFGIVVGRDPNQAGSVLIHLLGVPGNRTVLSRIEFSPFEYNGSIAKLIKDIGPSISDCNSLIFKDQVNRPIGNLSDLPDDRPIEPITLGATPKEDHPSNADIATLDVIDDNSAHPHNFAPQPSAQ